MSKSVLYSANTNSQTVAINGIINFGTIIRRYGCNCNLSGGNAVISGTGYYNIDTAFTFTASDAGTAVITLFNDGVAIPGATVSFTTAANSIYAVSIPAIIRQMCCCNSTITAIVTGVAGTVNNASILVSKT